MAGLGIDVDEGGGRVWVEIGGGMEVLDFGFVHGCSVEESGRVVGAVADDFEKEKEFSSPWRAWRKSRRLESFSLAR